MPSNSDLAGPYTYRPGGLPYHSWLVLKYERQIELEGSQNTARSIDASIKDATGQIADVITDNANDLRRSLDTISLSIGEFNADFNWHMDIVRVKLEDTNAILSKLRDELSRRHRTEAFEFYFQSLEYAEHGMFEKALHSIEVAIHGDERARGYELEWRFWEHLGRLRLGTLRNKEIDDLRKAEEAFLQAARLADRSVPKAAAGCLVGASFAAYASGRLSTAINHVRAALSREHHLAEAHWSLGRCLWQGGHFPEASEAFYDSLSLDPTYAKRFDEDDALQEPIEDYRRLRANLVEQFRKGLNRDHLVGLLAKARLLSKASAYLNLASPAARRVEDALEEIIGKTDSNDVRDAAEVCFRNEETRHKLQSDMNAISDDLIKLATDETEKMNEYIDRRKQQHVVIFAALSYAIGTVLSAIVFPLLMEETAVAFAISIFWPLIFLGFLLLSLFAANFHHPLQMVLLTSPLALGVAGGFVYRRFTIRIRGAQQRAARVAKIKAKVATAFPNETP